MTTIAPDALIDLQLHTYHSDGKWTPETLLDQLIEEGFSVAAITDHDRPDINPELQTLAKEKGFNLLAAVEMSSQWKGDLVDFLCFGFDPEDNALLSIGEDIQRRQRENSQMIFDNLVKGGMPLKQEEIDAILAKPAAHHVDMLVEMVSPHTESVGKTLLEAGFMYIITPPADIVRAAHESDAICILAHPGRGDGFVRFDRDLLDELRAEAPIDGIEAYYPLHSEEQVAFYLAYAEEHDLLVSSGSDSHDDQRQLPIKYRAENCARLLERLGIHVK